MILRSHCVKIMEVSLEGILNTLSEIQNDLAKKATSEEVNNLLDKLEEKEVRINLLEETVNEQKLEIERRVNDIENLQTRVDNLEKRVGVFGREFSYNRVLSDLNSRLIDDQEQVSRKVNLRIDGIEVTPNESTTSLMAHIIAECDKLNLGLIDRDFDRCHRVGPKFTSFNGKQLQSTILKLCSWRARNLLYINRKRLPFKVKHDLTKKRHEILKNVVELIDEDESVNKVVSFAFADSNCKLKFKTINNKFHCFSSLSEFSTLVVRLSFEQLMGEDFILDEQNNSLYY